MGDPVPFRGRTRNDAEPSVFEIPAAVVPGIARICALGLGLDELLGETCREIVALCGVDACYLVSYRERGGATEFRQFIRYGYWPGPTAGIGAGSGSGPGPSTARRSGQFPEPVKWRTSAAPLPSRYDTR